MSVGVELIFTVLGSVASAAVVIFSLGAKFSKYDTKITNNEKNIKELLEKVCADEKRIDVLEGLHKDVDNLGDKQREHERRVDGLARDVLELSTNILSRFSDEIRPIRESIDLLTRKSIQNESNIENFKNSVEDIKDTMKEIKHDIRTRPCISHGVHLGGEDVK